MVADAFVINDGFLIMTGHGGGAGVVLLSLPGAVPVVLIGLRMVAFA